MDKDFLIPDPIANDKQGKRFFHLDLPDLTVTELQDEIWALQPHLWKLKDEHWLRERVSKLEGELVKRRGYAGHKFSRRQPTRESYTISLK